MPFTVKADISNALRSYLGRQFPNISIPSIEERGTATIHSPVRINAGISVEPTAESVIAFEYLWADRSAMSQIVGDVRVDAQRRQFVPDQVLIRAVKDAHYFSLWGSYYLFDPLRLGLRFEYVPNTRPEKFFNPLSMSFDRFTIQVGLTWQVIDWFSITLEYAHHLLRDRIIRSSHYGPNALPTTPEEVGFDRPSPTGRYAAAANQFGFAFSFVYQLSSRGAQGCVRFGGT